MRMPCPPYLEELLIKGVSMSFLALLAILFIGLKLAGVITWPWLCVLAPIWFPMILAVGVYVACAVYGLGD